MSPALRNSSPRVTRAAASVAERRWPAGDCTGGGGACGVIAARGAGGIAAGGFGCGICSGRDGAGVGTAGAACGFGGSGATLGGGLPAVGCPDRSDGLLIPCLH